MLKALFKKQFLELNTYYFMDRKTGKMRSKGGTAGMIILFAFVFISVAFIFFGLGFSLADYLISTGQDWLYFSMMGIIAISIGTFGSVFNTYAGMYHAKDNELLLSMPIKPSDILLVRMSSVYMMSLLYTAISWVPALIPYWIFGRPGAVSVVFSILLTFVITLFVTVLTCLLGWIVALISGKMKNKSFITVIISLVFFFLYFSAINKMNNLLQIVMMNDKKIGSAIMKWIYPIYQLGLAASGKVVPMIIFTVFCAVLFAICMLILSKSFINIVTSEKGQRKEEYKEKEAKKTSVKNALLRKELKRFTSSATYMLNCGIGLFITLGISVFAIIRCDFIRTNLTAILNELPQLKALLPVVATALVCLVISTNAISAPSLSLEGENLWILQSLPISTVEILNVKQLPHILLNMPVAIISTIALGYVIEADFVQIIFMVVCTASFVQLHSAIGLAMGLKKPNLTWTNETVVIKQSMSVAVALFGGWLLAIISAVPAFFLSNKIDLAYYPLVVGVIFSLIARYINNWIKTKGTKIFEEL
ncbi:MAG: hypothetical protein KBT46_02620 [Ruminococcus sp.]|nr:hypothetical protein [Candidatus Copronaster equi]